MTFQFGVAKFAWKVPLGKYNCKYKKYHLLYGKRHTCLSFNTLLWKRASGNWDSLFCGCPSGQRRFLELKRIWSIGQMTVLDCIFNSTDPFKWFYTRDITIYIVGNTIDDDILVTRYIFIKTKAVIAFLYDKYGNLEQWELKLKVLTLNNIWPLLNSIMDSIDSWRDPFHTRPP